MLQTHPPPSSPSAVGRAAGGLVIAWLRVRAPQWPVLQEMYDFLNRVCAGNWTRVALAKTIRLTTTQVDHRFKVSYIRNFREALDPPTLVSNLGSWGHGFHFRDPLERVIWVISGYWGTKSQHRNYQAARDNQPTIQRIPTQQRKNCLISVR